METGREVAISYTISKDVAAMPYFTSSSCGPRTVSAEAAFGPGPPVGALQGRGPAQVR